MTFKEVGEALREERLRRGLSIDDVMQRTKVGRRHVEAMEEGRVGDLPHPVYVKGFMKTYSGFLNVEIPESSRIVDLAFAEYADQSDAQQGEWFFTNEVPLSARRRQKKKKTSDGKGSRHPEWLYVPLVLLLLFGIGFLLWFIFHTQEPAVVQERSESKSTASTSAAPPIPIPTTSLPQAEPSASPAAPLVQQPAPPPLPPAVPETRAPVAVAAPEPLQPPSRSTTVPSAPVEPAPAETAVAPREPEAPRILRPMVIASEEAKSPAVDLINVLEIVGDGECWVEARVDAALTTDIFVRKGERVDIRFVQSLSVKFGNMKMVRLRYNGREVASQGAVGGVRTLTFPPAR